MIDNIKIKIIGVNEIDKKIPVIKYLFNLLLIKNKNNAGIATVIKFSIVEYAEEFGYKITEENKKYVLKEIIKTLNEFQDARIKLKENNAEHSIVLCPRYEVTSDKITYEFSLEFTKKLLLLNK